MADGAIRTPDQRLRVFISSTLGELAEERRAARAAVEQLRLTPVMFELGARPHPPRALYRSYLEQSDVFVGVYWQRYGWVAPDMEISGLEDELVLSAGMPRLIYVKRPATDMEPRLAELLARLEREDTASYKPFGDADELRDLLLDDLAILLTERFDDVHEPSPSRPGPRHNLPAQTSSFLGRETELRALADALADDQVRLVTLTGPGGSGKTRLAIQAAMDEVDRYADGVFFVDLSGERQVEGAFAAVARALCVAVPSETRPLEMIESQLRDRRVLLVLDNFEQVLPAAVGVVELLERCPGVEALVTSRESLRVRGERVLLVPPMSLPDVDSVTVAESEAVRLFCERATAVQPTFRCGDDDAEDVAAICRRLDGLPLAIELAAACVQLFDVRELRVRLEERFDILRGGPRDLPKRQQALGDTISWSYDLLNDDERTLLRVFAVFADARLVDLEAMAGTVSALGSVDVLGTLGSLVDKSLVRSGHGSDGRPRFSMLHTIRAYASEQLDADPELAASARRAHAEHYTGVAVGLHRELTRAARNDVLALLGDELGNMRAAWDEWVDRGELARLNELLAPLWGYYDARGDYRSAIELGNDLLERLAVTPDSPERRRDEFAVRMNVIRTEIAVRGFTVEAERMMTDALERADVDRRDVRQRFPGLRSLAYMHMMRCDLERTSAMARELMAMAEAEQDPVLLSEAHLFAGLSSIWEDDLPTALAHIDTAVEHIAASPSGYVDFRVGPNPAVVANVVSGLTRFIAGMPDTASKMLQSALDLAAELDHPYSTAYALHHGALLDLWRQDLEGVASRAEALLAIAERHDYPTWRALGLVLGGLALVGSGDVDAGLARVETGFELYRGLSAPPIFWPALLMIRARAFGMAGRAHEAMPLIEEAEATLQPGNPLAPDVGIAKGDFLLGLSPPDLQAAEAAFEDTAKMAGEIGARMAQLQALTRLAALRRGTPAEADTLRSLRAVFDGFTEGFETPDLLAARAALDA